LYGNTTTLVTVGSQLLYYIMYWQVTNYQWLS